MLYGLPGLTFLGSAVWQGISAIAAIVALLLYIWIEVLRRRRAQHPGMVQSAQVRFFDLSDTATEKVFYQELAKSIREATGTIYRSGRGFDRARREPFIAELLAAERDALEKGVEITRIQLAVAATEPWAEHAAQLLEEFPDRLHMFADFAEPPLVNVGIIDPFSAAPVIQLLFEATEPTVAGEHSRSASALFMYGQGSLAASLAYQFVGRTHRLAMMSAADVRELGRSYVYFAYGSNVSSVQMRARVPGARVLGKAVLYGWKLNFRVYAEHFGGGAAAGIEESETDTDFVEGLAYALSISDKRRLDEIEFGGYRPATVGIKVNGVHRDAFAHVPVRLSDRTDLRPSTAYLDVMTAGAREYGLTHLLSQLAQIRGTTRA